ncbi:MAG: asparagine synthase (glutamine-hydrolyzing) [Desulfobulbus sp.]|nr:asparagine synthase (glutamine-hydrolyzing) [Desulfobulbus sp.]
MTAMNRSLAYHDSALLDLPVDEHFALIQQQTKRDSSVAGVGHPGRFGDWVLAYIGKIYNSEELEKNLIYRGYSFTSANDAELVLKAWDCWGEECLPRLEGQFAFCIANAAEQRFHLCRDRFGTKPLFYSNTDNEFLFSSNLRTLMQARSRKPEPDLDALAVFLAIHYVPAPQTGWKYLQKLRPGHILTATYSGGQLQVAEPVAWHRPFSPIDTKEGISLDKLDRVLAQSVQEKMGNAPPIGAFLSGGVDSSLICHYASQHSTEPLHTFSIGFTDAGPEYDETAYALQAAQAIGARHHAVQVELGGISERIERILTEMDELNADSSVFLNHIVCEEASRYVSVCLSGAGGDELFGGYFRHQALLALELLHKIPKPLIRAVRAGLQPLPQNRDQRLGNLVRRLIRFFDQRDDEQSNFLTIIRQDRVYPQNPSFFQQPGIHTLLKALEFDFNHFLGDNILSFTDKVGTLYGLEIPVPFLDSKVVQLAEQMKNNQRATLFAKKILLKQLAARYFPKNLIYRKKQGFAAPLEVWLRNLSKEELKRRCLGESGAFLVPEPVINQLVDSFLDDRRDLSLQLFALIVMNAWYQGGN